jgi:hypothetical protein
MGPEDPSAAITRGRLDTREWQTLRRMGVSTTAGLADLDPEAPEFFEEYYPEVTHLSRTQALKRLRGAVQQAQLIRCFSICIQYLFCSVQYLHGHHGLAKVQVWWLTIYF